jgi:hypothetical protein
MPGEMLGNSYWAVLTSNENLQSDFHDDSHPWYSLGIGLKIDVNFQLEGENCLTPISSSVWRFLSFCKEPAVPILLNN